MIRSEVFGEAVGCWYGMGKVLVNWEHAVQRMDSCFEVEYQVEVVAEGIERQR